jgi:kynurenine formamidase
MKTGWASKWEDMDAYRNMDEEGTMHFPGFSPEAGKFLIDKRSINGIGIDNLSVDAGAASGFPTHDIVNGAGKYNLENVGDLADVPASGAFLIVAPIKLEGGSGGQVRIFAVIP